jgi:hypothetical protein
LEEAGMSWLIVPAATVAFVVLLVLPGFGLLRAFRLGGHGASSDLLRAVAFSIVLMAAISSTAFLIRMFSPAIVLIPLLALGLIGIPAFLRLVVKREMWPLLVACSLLSLPWAITAMREGFPTAARFQWYYWELGKALTSAGGIPNSATEWLVQPRWLPDYLYFNVLSEAYRGLLFMASDTQALAAWRYPVAFMGYLLVFLLLRLWVGRFGAYAGLILLSITDFFALRLFDVYKPESVGLIVGIAAAWLVIAGVRRSQPPYLILAGALIGINLGIHGIAATVFGLLAIAAGFVEWLDLKQGRPRAALVLGCSAVLALAIAASSGLLFQGRALVASEALHSATRVRPELMEGSDPTWTFLQRSAGNFNEEPPPVLADQLVRGWETRLDGVVILERPWLGLVVVVLAGIAVAIFRSPRKLQSGFLTINISILLLGILICFFLLAFDTYVPRHTGAARLLGYGAVFLSFLTALSLGALWHPLSNKHPWENISRGFPVLVLIAALGVGFQAVDQKFRSLQAMDPSFTEALEALASRGDRSDIVLSNIATYGIIESFTDMENPLEARQPLFNDPIGTDGEEPGLLIHANDLLFSIHDFFESGNTNSTVDEIGVDWILVADRPSILGAAGSYGGTVSSLATSPNLDMVWARPGVAIFEYVSQQDLARARLDRFESIDEALGAYAAGVWTFDEGRGVEAFDTSGHGNNGAIQGALRRCDDTPYHLIGDSENRCALQFDVPDGRVVIPTSPSLNFTETVTVSAWVKQTGNATSRYQRVIGKDGTLALWMDDQNRNICIRLAGTSKDTPGDQVCFPANFSQNTWYHVMFTYDKDAAERLHLYLNGVLIGTSNEYRGPLGASSADVIIGNWNAGTRPFHGLISDLRIYSTALVLDRQPNN